MKAQYEREIRRVLARRIGPLPDLLHVEVWLLSWVEHPLRLNRRDFARAVRQAAYMAEHYQQESAMLVQRAERGALRASPPRWWHY